MACQVPPVSQLTNTQQLITPAQLAQSAAADIAYQLGIALTVGDTIIPLAPFIWAALAIEEILGLFGGGRPKDEDTNNVIWAYNMSAYEPLHALASDLAIALKNGAPISDSRPAIQAQFSTWKQGTIESIQQQAGLAPGASSPGYWQLQQLINTSWAYSKNGQQAVLQVVKAIDCFTEVLSQIAQQTKPPPPPPPPTPPPPPLPPSQGPCVSYDSEADEILDLCNAVNNSLGQILNAIQNLELTGGGTGDTACCTSIVAAIVKVAQQLNIIATALAMPDSTPLNIDFSPIVTALGGLVTAIGAYPPALEACCKAINTSLGDIAKAISSAPGTDVSGIVKQLTTIATQGDVDQAIFTALEQMGTLNPADLQTLQGIKWSDAVTYVESLRGVRTVEKFTKDVAGDALTIANDIAKVATGIGRWSEKVITGALTVERNVIQDVLEPIIAIITSALKPAGAKQIGSIGVNPDTVLSDVVAAGINSYAITALIGLKFPGAAEQLARIAEIATGVLGFDELKEVQIGPLVSYGIARIAEMQAKKLFGQELPGAGALAALQARGLITGAQYLTWVPYTGLPGELWEQTRESAYSGLGARRILPLVQTGLFSQADIADELTFSGLRPASMKRYLLAAPFLATNTERNALKSSLEKAYIAGLFDAPTLSARIDSAEQNVDRDSLVLERADLELLIAATKDLEAEYTTMYIGGLIDDPTYRSYLAGIGLQPNMVNFVAGKAEARANATLRRKELAAAAALQKATASVERQTALKNFEEGNTPVALYTGTLIETGLTPVQAAAWTDLAVLKKAGNVRWVYGLQLTPAQATVLKQRVTALTDQRKRQLISQQDYVNALAQLGISNTWVNALDSTAEAMLTPKTSAFAVAVQT